MQLEIKITNRIFSGEFNRIKSAMNDRAAEVNGAFKRMKNDIKRMRLENNSRFYNYQASLAILQRDNDDLRKDVISLREENDKLKDEIQLCRKRDYEDDSSSEYSF